LSGNLGWKPDVKRRKGRKAAEFQFLDKLPDKSPDGSPTGAEYYSLTAFEMV